ncbi:MAG: hypothetical protein JRJ68_03325 [Deltaproteobacteria bacterium]|nr:hypothetical protein [Deltaproteobacteria bacterium]
MRVLVQLAYGVTAAGVPFCLVLYFTVSSFLFGNPGFSVDKTQHGLRIARIHKKLNPVQVDDLIIEIDRVPYDRVLRGFLLKSANRQNPIVSLASDKVVDTFSLRTIPHTPGSVLSLIWLHLLLITVFISLGLIALLRAPPDKLTRLFFFMLCGFAGSIASTLASQLGLVIPSVTSVSFFALTCCNWLAFGAWAHFACCFPQERDLSRNRPWLPPLFYILPPLLTVTLSLILAGEGSEFLGMLQRLRNMFLPIIIVGAFGKHLVDFYILPPDIVRNQIKFPLAAYWLSFGPYFFLYLLPNLLIDRPLIYFRTAAIAFLILPLAYLFALLRYRLFAVDKLLSKILAYILLIIFFTGLYAAFLLAVKHWFLGKNTLSEELFLLFLVLVIAGFNPALSRVHKAINRYIFGNQLQPASILHAFSNRISTALEISDLVNIVTLEFAEQFGLDKIALVISSGDQVQIYPKKYSSELSGGEDTELIIKQLADNEFILCQIRQNNGHLSKKFATLRQDGWSMAFRLQGSRRINGLLWIGNKKSGRIFNDDNILFLATLSNHIGIALENSLRFTSLSDSKRQQEEMFDQMVQQKKMAALGEMSTVLAHELKNPLAVIRSAAQHLNTTPPPSEIMDEMLAFIIDEVDSLNLTINSLLTHARHRNPTFQPIDLLKTIPALLKKWQLTKDHNPNIQTSYNLPGKIPPLYADISQLGQILLNVIRNSEEAMGESGKLSLSLQEEGEHAIIVISDNGPGIKKIHPEKLFQNFFSTKERGLGLGLSVCRQLVNAHSGTIAIKNGKNCGAKVTLCLPFYPQPSTQPSPAD